MKIASLLGFGTELVRVMFPFPYAFLVLLGFAIRANKAVTLEEDRKEENNINPSK